MKTKHGGIRQGAGRKPRTTPRKAITVRLEPVDTARLTLICKAKGISQAKWVSEQINLVRSTIQ